MKDLGIKVFLDSANLDEMCAATEVDGFTTNPTLMRRTGVVNYENWARAVLSAIRLRPVSFEVLADTLEEMEQQAYKIASWGDNVYVKIPIMTTRGELTCGLIAELNRQKIKLNITAVMNEAQVKAISEAAIFHSDFIVSIFAGRVADAGVDPHHIVRFAVAQGFDNVLWASTREVFNVMQAIRSGADIITLTPDILKKLNLIGKDLHSFSLETVQQFYSDAVAAGYTL